MSSSILRYAVARAPTPLLNTPDFRSSFGGPSGTEIPLDGSKLLRSVESIAFEGSKFKILEQISDHIVRTSTQEYPHMEVYVDRRFLRFVNKEPSERERSMPTVRSIRRTLESLLGTRYIWGGTWPSGVPSLLEYYPPKVDLSHLDPLIADTWQLKGIDCSGLLQYATDGSTPRNTSRLVYHGNSVAIEGKTPEEIAKTLHDLDLIVWNGHVVIVVDRDYSIESLLGEGVIKKPLVPRLREIMYEKKRIPLDDYDAQPELGDRFVVRRWHPDNM